MIKPSKQSYMIYIYNICKFGMDRRRFVGTMGPLAFNVNQGYFKSAGRSLNIGRREIIFFK